MKSSSIIAIGGGIAAAIIIGIALTMSGVSDSPQTSENFMGEPIETSAPVQSEKIQVLATFYPYYEFARNVAGDSATVTQYMPSGIETHDWEPRPQEIQSLKDADVLVYNGLGMEPYVDNMIDSGEFDNVLFLKASERVELIKPEEVHGAHEEEGNGHHHDFENDPHIWLDPILVKHQVNNIRDGLIETDPQNKGHYEQNALAYNQELDELDMKFKSSLASCNKDTFVPFHNAFTYLAERYDIKVKSIGGLTPDAEATAAEIAEFIDFIKDNDIKIIFSEELVDPRLAEVIADEAGAEVLLFSPLEALSTEEEENNVTYIEKMEQNINALKLALECQ